VVTRHGPGSGYGGYRPLGSLPPSGPPPASPPRGPATCYQTGADQPESGDEQHAPGTGPDEPGGHWDERHWDEQGAPWERHFPAGPQSHVVAGPEAEDGPGAGPGPEPGAEPGPVAAFGPWETYETGEGYGWASGYGAVPDQGWAAVPDQGWARPDDDDQAQPDHDAARGGAAAGAVGAHARDTVPEAHAGYGIVAPEPEAPPERGERPGWQAESADSLTADLLLPGRHAAPPPGWRRALYQVTGGRVRAPQSAADRRRKDLVQRARTPVAGGHHRVAVLSLKGGVGKTTTTVGLGSTLASQRGDRVIAVDANPDRGTLSDKLRLETAATVRDLLNEEGQIHRYADVRAYTTQSPSGLEVLASDRDPTVSVAFSDQDYVDVARVLEHYYSVSITDCGTGLLHSAMAGVLRLADQIVLVSSPSVDGARSASATLDWLAAHHYGDLVRGAVVVLSAIRPRSKSAVDLARLEQHFAARCRAVVRIPYDAHLEEGAEVDLAQLSRATADAYLVLAAEVGDGFSWPRH
jgi:MinD-like ATPase involved in chromosome partitioning or flagellar assembly